MNYEEEITQLIANSGMAKSFSMEAIQEARAGNPDRARELLEDAKESFILAHAIQTNLITQEMSGEKVELSLLMVHAQDHLMTSMTTRDLAVEIINLYDVITELKERLWKIYY